MSRSLEKQISKILFNLLRFIAFSTLVSAATAAPKAEPQACNFLVLGDSLSASYGIDPQQGWVERLQRRWASRYPQVNIVNASVSGATTADGLQRLPTYLRKYQPQWVVIELGGNDGLQGKPIPYIKNNLDRLITLASAAAQTYVVGMRIPPNLGSRYTEPFFSMYAQLAKKYASGYDPFLLAGVATHNELMQDDGIHPNAAGQQKIFERLSVELEKWLDPQRCARAAVIRAEP